MRPSLGARRYVVRVRFITAGFLLCAALVGVRLYYLQVMRGAEFALRADRQFLAPASLFNRGSIFFTAKDGEKVAAATLKVGVSLAVNPQKITDAQAAWERINAIVPLDHDTFMARASRPARYVLVADKLTSEQGNAIQALEIPGIEVHTDRWRWYPGDTLAAQEIGFMAYNENSFEGRYGVERYYEETLKRTGGDLYDNFFVSLFASARALVKGTSGDVVTALEPSVQAELERQLAAYQDKWHAKKAGGIIMDPNTGAIYAMAVYPSFNLNAFGSADPASFHNPLIEDSYEMGSIIKPLTIAAGIDTGVITSATTYTDTGCIVLNTKTICNFDRKARGVSTMQDILSQSLNVGASFVAGKLGPDRVRDYFLRKYKLGTETGIDLPGEASGMTDNLDSPRELEYATASFGQGIATTPVATARALATLANNGRLVTPHIGTAIIDDTGIARELSWGGSEQVLKPETTREVSRMLTTAVDEVLAGGSIKLAHYSVAAKTGTAQIANPEGGGYYDDRTLHSFFGYFPSFDARFIIFLYAYEPVGAPYSSQTWSEPFHELTQFLIQYYAIPPDR